MSDWTFLTDHAHVLVLLAREPRSTAQQLAQQAGLDVATVAAILRDLEAGEYTYVCDPHPSMKGSITVT